MNGATTDRFTALHPSPEFEEFRDLLLSSEKREIDSLGERVEDIRSPNAIGDRLPEAISHSVKTDRSRMAAAMFPILGPAIRLYVNEMFKSLVDQMNISIQNATSLQRFRWRREAKTSGIPFSEYVLLKTLNYCMDDVLLIDPQSGLLRLHVWRGEESSLQSDADLVSGMLAAIRSFAKDTLSLKAEISPGYCEEPELERFSFGDYEIFVHTGPNSILAVIGSGVPPKNYRDLLHEVSENIHARFNDELINFDRDHRISPEVTDEMNRLLVEHRPVVEKAKTWPAWVVTGAAVLGISAWLIFSHHREATWQRGIEALRSTPGIEVVDFKKSGSWNGERMIRILKDPLAKDPTAVLTEEIGDLAQRAQLKASPYLSMEPDFVDARNSEADQKQSKLTATEASLREELSANILSILNNESEALNSKFEAIKTILAAPPIVNTGQLTEVLFENRFSGAGAQISKKGDLWEVSGSVAEPFFTRIHEETTGLILDGGSVGFAGLTRQRSEFEIRSEAIQDVMIEYPSGRVEMTQDVEIAFETVIGKMKSLDKWCLDSGRALPFFEIHALPVVGENAVENHGVEEARLKQLHQAATQAGIGQARINLRHDARPLPERFGLYVQVSKSPLFRSTSLPRTP